MKFPFFKVFTVSCAIVLAWNCSNEATNADTYVPQEAYWAFESAGQTLQITPSDYAVRDASGNVIGYYDVNTTNIVDLSGATLITNLDLRTLDVVNLDGTVTPASYTPSTQDNGQPVVIDPNNQGTITQPTDNNTQTTDPSANPATNPSTDPASNPSTNPTDNNQNQQAAQVNSSASEATPKSSATNTPKSSSSEKKSDGGKIGNLTYTGSLEQDVANDGSIQTIVFSNVQSDPNGSRDWKLYFLDMKYDGNAKTLTITGTVRDQKDKTLSESFQIDGNAVTITLNIGNAAKGNTNSNNNNNQQQAKSSSSKAKSSSSQAKSSSSQQQQQQQQTNGADPTYKVKNGGRSGQGWGSRYWDCCMPHCAWKGNTSKPTKVCNAQMEVVKESVGSVCNAGGQGGVCDIQAPWAVNDKFAFAFAAVPAGLGGECGKCFLLTFNGGTSNGGDKANCGGLNGKKMIIMVSNIGGDVGSNQFDIMIPGGGVGQFNGCGTQLGINSTGAQYGGFITDCQSDPNCVKQKCAAFSKYPKLQAGCEFSATWMGGANNPTFTFEELESCPSEIAERW